MSPVITWVKIYPEKKKKIQPVLLNVCEDWILFRQNKKPYILSSVCRLCILQRRKDQIKTVYKK